MFHDLTFADATRIEGIDADRTAFMMDEETFRAFYDRTARGVWVYLFRVTGDRHAADDLLQEAFYRFLRADSDYESESHRRNSLYRIATNLARDARRRNLIRLPAELGHGGIESIAVGDHAGTTERQTDVSRAMGRLKPRERAMLWLAYAEGASHREIADAVGVGQDSVKSLLFRARRKMAGLLRGDAR